MSDSSNGSVPRPEDLDYPSTTKGRRRTSSVFRQMNKALKNRSGSRYAIPTVTRVSIAMNALLFILLLCASFAWSSKEADMWLSKRWIWTIGIFVPSWFTSFAIVEAVDEIFGGGTSFFGMRDLHLDILKVLVQLVMAACTSFLGIYIAFSPCFSCARHYISEGLVSDGVSPFLFGKNNNLGLWRVLFDPESGAGVDPATEVCRACLSWLVWTFAIGGTGDSESDEFSSAANSPIAQNNSIDVVKSRHDLIPWYNTFHETESKKFLASSWDKLLQGLVEGGQFSNEELRDILDDLLCSPVSFDPNPDQFISALERPRFTGEDVEGGNGLEIPVEKLQAIMRGDMLRKLGPSVCFMLRFSLLIQEDTSSERFPISSVLDEKTLLSETDMKVQDTTVYDVPGLVLAGMDPDFDLQSKQIETIKTAIDLYTRLPFEDKQYYFDTKEEYLAFFRWNIEGSIQSEWYLPTWLNRLTDSDGGNNDYASFLSEQQIHSPDLTAYVDPQSDRTLSDRCFFGTGMKFMASLKLPGDKDYHYLHPARPDYYITSNHTNFYRYTNKPKKDDFLRMAKSFWPDEFDTSSSCDATTTYRSSIDGQCSLRVETDNILLQLRSRIVEIDLAFIASLAGRKQQFYPAGAILYLDTDTRMPVGVFKTNRTEEGQDVGTLYLPKDKRDWEHAKLTYRTAERAALAAIHVIESHLGWSHAISLATLQTIPSDHKLLALLKPFTLGVHVVNSAAYHMLVREHSILTHASGLDNVPDALNYFGHHINFSETFPDILAAKKLDTNLTKDLPLFSQGQVSFDMCVWVYYFNQRDTYHFFLLIPSKRLWNVHYEFVEDFVNTIVYDSDDALRADDSLHRFWHHVNTFGRGHDPCVCDMDADSFYKKGAWPNFDSTRQSCENLLDSANFQPELTTPNERRLEWCLQDDYLRINALKNMLEHKCKTDIRCNRLNYSFEHMRLDNRLPLLSSRKQLVDFITSAIWHVTVGHRINADNIPALTDPTFSGVRAREMDNDEELPVMVDVGTYVFGVTIGALTTVKSNALLGDWTPIYSFLAETQDALSQEERSNLFNGMVKIHRRYKSKLLKLSRDFLRESASRPKNQQTNVFNPASTSASVGV